MPQLPKILGVLCLLLYASGVYSQPHRCAWEYIKEQHQATQSLPSAKKKNKKESLAPVGVIITIPVIFHIIHDGKPLGIGENVSKSFLLAQIDQLNDDFRRNNQDRGKTPALFLPDAADVEIEFCLAKQNPDGFPTSGIQRYNFGIPDYSPSEFKHVVQSKTTWDRDLYLNIWVCDLRGYLGYAYLPGGQTIGDGLVVDYTTVGSLSYPNPVNTPYKYGRTATHEIGHWLGLDHHWAVVNNCFSDDGVADTPKQFAYYLGNPSHPKSSCNSTDMFMNFLDYVNDNAMNLYTKGQKSVMRNTLYNERSGILISHGCESPSPVIMFDHDNITSMEGTQNCSSTSGMNMTVNMKIAAPPNRSATVTIIPSGSAVLGRDYTLSRKYLTFSSGRTTSHSFKIQWAPDAYVENMKDIIFKYSLSSGGGNAKKGKSQQSMSVNFVDDDSPALPFEVMRKNVGSYNGSNAESSPFRGGSNDSRMQILYKSQDLKNAGLKPGWVNSISFFITQKRSNRTYSNFNLKLALTNQVDFPKYSNFTSGLTSFFSGNLYTVAGKMKITLDQPFFWDGYSNLMLEACFDNTSSSSDDLVKFQNTGLNNTVLFEIGNKGSGCNYNFMPTRHSLRPIIEVELEHGQYVAIDKNSYSGYIECDLSGNETVHFYDANSGNILLTIKNLESHNYGCTKVEIDRDGKGAFSLWGSIYESTGKTFKITPEYNKTNGKYQILLYYSKEEIESWERNNRLRLSKSDLALLKCKQSISSSTLSSCQSYPLTYQAFGGDFVFKTEVNNGFSGFTLSNWQSGYLAISTIELSGEKIESTIQLHAEIQGITENEELFWFKESVDGLTQIHHSNDHISLDQSMFIDHPTEGGEIRYHVESHAPSGRIVKSNTISFLMDKPWSLTQVNGNWKVINSMVEADFSIYNITGVLLKQFNLDQSEARHLDLSNAPGAMFFVVRTVSNHSEVRRLVTL